MIQASYTRALAHKIKLADILDTLGEVAPQVDSAARHDGQLRHRLSPRAGEVRRRRASGAASPALIVPDLPVEESAQLAEICRRATSA